MKPEGQILRCTGIHKNFSLDRQAAQASRDSSAVLHVLKGIDLDLAPGEVVSIVGASGSGKSTLLHILGGLDHPTSGSVHWGEVDIAEQGDDALAALRARHVGFVFQFHYLLPEFTALENVMIPMRILGDSEETAREKAGNLLKDVGLFQRAGHKPGALSGGEQQRVAVARALANQPRVVLADEPSGNLDSANGQMLHELFLTLNQTRRQSFLIVTHNEQFAKSSGRVYRMVDGQLRKH